MSEMKEYLCVEALVPYTKEIPGYLIKCAKYRAPQAEMELVYLKSEADKVIAELEEKHLRDLQDAEDSFKSVLELNCKRTRRHKYKRCLAMAERCGDACDKWMMRKAKAISLGKDGVEEYHQARRKWFHYMKWQKRWLELAEKFKEAK